MRQDQKKKEVIEKTINCFFQTYKAKSPGYVGALLEQQQLVRLSLAEQILTVLDQYSKLTQAAGIKKSQAHTPKRHLEHV